MFDIFVKSSCKVPDIFVKFSCKVSNIFAKSRVRCPIYLSDYNRNWSVSVNANKTFQYEMVTTRGLTDGHGGYMKRVSLSFRRCKSQTQHAWPSVFSSGHSPHPRMLES